MDIKSFFLITISPLLLAGCTVGGPSNMEAMEAVYSVYFIYPSIVDKVQCELTPSMQSEGHSNVWLIRYNFKYEGKQKTEEGMLISETNNAGISWQVYQTDTLTCPSQTP